MGRISCHTEKNWKSSGIIHPPSHYGEGGSARLAGIKGGNELQPKGVLGYGNTIQLRAVGFLQRNTAAAMIPMTASEKKNIDQLRRYLGREQGVQHGRRGVRICGGPLSPSPN